MQNYRRLKLLSFFIFTISIVFFGCNGDSSTLSRPPNPLMPPTVTPPPSQTGEAWVGTATVQSLNGPKPSCMPVFWREGFVADIKITFLDQTGSNGENLLNFSQPDSGESCTMSYTITKDEIEAKSYFRDPMGDVGSCHFALNTANWGCAAPQVWLLDEFHLNGMFTDASKTHIQGNLEMPYAFSNGGSWSTLTIEKGFQIEKD